MKPYQEQGNTISFLILENHLAAIVALGDVVKQKQKEFIRTLKERKITPVMLTGDNKNAAQAVADYLGIEEYYGGLLPDDKKLLSRNTLTKGKSNHGG